MRNGHCIGLKGITEWERQSEEGPSTSILCKSESIRRFVAPWPHLPTPGLRVRTKFLVEEYNGARFMKIQAEWALRLKAQAPCPLKPAR